MKRVAEFDVNGERCDVVIEPHTTLVEVLRDQLGLTGTKHSCSTGECGACTVLRDGEPILSCLTLASTCAGVPIVTIEGLARGGALSPVQEAFLDAGAIQCGFCTPGMVLTTTALLDRVPNPGRDRIAKALEGSLCRCTGYNRIVEAVETAAARIADRRAGGSP